MSDHQVIRIAVCQIGFHPAAYTANVAHLREPWIVDDPFATLSHLGKFGIDVSSVQEKIESQYLDWAKLRLQEILDFLQSFDPHPDLVLFPEFSIPFQILDLVRDFSSGTQATVLAGSQSYQGSKETKRAYRDIGVPERDLKALTIDDCASVLPVIFPKKTKLLKKQSASPYEFDDTSPLLESTPQLQPIKLPSKKKTLFLPMICAEALAGYQVPENKYTGVAAIACSSKTSYFSSIFDNELAQKRFATLCNDARYGASCIFTNVDQRAQNWWMADPIKGCLPPGEAILICDVNPHGLAVEVGVTNPARGLRLVYVGNITYAVDRYKQASVSATLNEIRALENHAARAQELKKLLQSGDLDALHTHRVRQLHYLATGGRDNSLWWDTIGHDLIIKKVSSLSHLEALNAENVETCLNEQLPKLSTSSSDAAQCLVKCLSIAASLKPADSSSDSRSTRGNESENSDVFGRDAETGILLRFFNNETLVCQSVFGLTSIGKSAVISKAVAQAGIRKLIKIPLRETSSPDFVLYSILRPRFGHEAPPYDDVESVISSHAFREALSGIDLVVLQNFESVVDEKAWGEFDVDRFLSRIFDIATKENTKIILETRRFGGYEPTDPLTATSTRIDGLDSEHAIRLLDRQLRQNQLSTNTLTSDQKQTAVKLLGGHPVGIAMLASAVYEVGATEALHSINQQSGFYEKFIRRLFGTLSLSNDEKNILRLVAGSRIGVPREIILGACDFPASEAIGRLITACILNVTEQSHLALPGVFAGIFKIEEAPVFQKEKFHRLAADTFGKLAESHPADLSFSIEADYHRELCGKSPKYALGLTDARLDAARELYETQKYEDAQRILDELLKLSKRKNILSLSSRTDAQCGDFTSAIAKARELSQRFSPDPWLINDLTKIALTLRRRHDAEDLLKLAKDSGVDAQGLDIAKGRLALMRNDLNEAEESFRRAINISSRNAWPYFYLGRTLIREGRLAEAIDSLKDGLRFIDERDVRGWFVQLRIRCLLATAYLYSSEDENAESMIVQLIEDDPNDAEVVRLSAALALKEEGVEGAQAAIERFLKTKVKKRFDRSQLHLYLGFLYLHEGKNDRAAKEFTEAHKADNNNVFILVNWARSLLSLAESLFDDEDAAQGYAQDCGRIIDRILILSPENPQALDIQHRLYNSFQVDSGRGRAV